MHQVNISRSEEKISSLNPFSLGSRRAETTDWSDMINATAYMIPPIIEKMDTASLDITNGSRAQLHATTQHTNNNWNSCSLVNCEDCCTVNLRTKSNTWGCKKHFMKWNLSFQSWSVRQNQVDQLRILLCNFCEKASMKNVKQRTCSLVNCK